MLAGAEPFEDDHLGGDDVGAELARALGRGEAVVRVARADRVGDPLHGVTRFEQADDGLQDADVRLAAGDDERVAAGGQAAQEAFLGRRREVELGERRVAERGDLGNERAEAVGFSSVPMTWMPSSRAAVASWTQRRTTVSPSWIAGISRTCVSMISSVHSSGLQRMLIARLLGIAHSGTCARRRHNRRRHAGRDAMLMNAAEYRESLRRYSPRVFVDGARVESVADAPALQPGINALGVTYDFALRDELAPIMRAVQASSGKTVNRMLHVDQSSADLLNKLEAVRVLCQETGCAQRYLAHDAFSALAQSTARIDADKGTRYGERFTAWLHDFQDKDLSVGIAMTDAKGDRSKRPHEQANVDSYVHIVEKNAKGIVISGTKAIVTGAPYVHEFLVMPCRNMSEADAAFAVCCAVPCDADGVTIVARPAGRPARRRRCSRTSTASRPASSSSTASSSPGSASSSPANGEHSAHLTYSYATHHRHTCIAARAGFGDLLIGAGALMCEANGFDPEKSRTCASRWSS